MSKGSIPDAERCHYRYPKTGARCPRRIYSGVMPRRFVDHCHEHHNTVPSDVGRIVDADFACIIQRADLPHDQVTRLLTIIREEYRRIRSESKL